MIWKTWGRDEDKFQKIVMLMETEMKIKKWNRELKEREIEIKNCEIG